MNGELPPAQPESVHISPARLKQLEPIEVVSLSLALSGRLFGLKDAALKTADQDQQEVGILRQRLARNSPRNLNLQDPDKLWLTTHILLPTKEAKIAYEIIRTAEITVLGGRVPASWSSERIHQELVKNPGLLQKFNQRQILLGEGASISLLDQELRIQDRAKQKRGLSRRQKIVLAGGAAMVSGAALLGVSPSRPSAVEISPTPISTPAQPTTEPTLTKSTTPTLVPSPFPISTALAQPTAKPTEVKPTATPVPPTPAPEVKTYTKNLFTEKIAPQIYNEVLKRRAERAKKDPKYYERINDKLNEGRINFLITGGRLEDPLTDSIQVFSYDIATNTLNIISLPRDLQSPEVLRKTGDSRNSRINQALGEGGPELLREVVENAFALSMDFYIHGHFDVVTDAIDQTVGTIEVDLERDIHDDVYPIENYGSKRIHYPKGKNTLNGQQAVEVARSRHGSSDYDRSKRQQKVIEAFVQKLTSEDFFTLMRHLKILDDLWNQKQHPKDPKTPTTIQADFDLNQLLFSQLYTLAGQTPGILWSRVTGNGAKIAEKPTIITGNINNTNFVVGAGIPNIAITKLSGGNAYSPNPRKDYWASSRRYAEKLLTSQAGQKISPEDIKVELPAREQKILHPAELTNQEVRPWVGKLRNSHQSVLTESLFTKELAAMPEGLRQKVLTNIAQAYAKALVQYYGDTEAIIGLDPGHGGTDVGSAAVTADGKTIREKDATWQLAQAIAEQIYQQSAGKYFVVFLRPEMPQDKDLDGDGIISTVERLQKRKALLLQMEQKLRPDPATRGQSIVYLAVHFNGSSDSQQKGAETFWPNSTAVDNAEYRDSSKELAQQLQQQIVSAIKEAGYQVDDRGAKEDPDTSQPLGNADSSRGPYVALGSPKLDRPLTY